MKLLKMIFSRACLTAIFLILQLVAIFAAVYFFNQYFIVFQILSSLLGLIVFLVIVNKREPAEFKLPWLVLVLLIPLFGVLLYLLFGSVRLPKKAAAALKKQTDALAGYLSESEKDAQTLPPEQLGLRNYLKANARTFGSRGNRVTYFKLGEEFFEDLILSLKGAEKFILMEYFLIFPGKMWSTIHEILVEKVKEGVDVKVMYDDIGTLGMQKNDYWKTLRQEGIDCRKFNPFRPVVSAIFNNRDHRKITVVDGKIAYTGGVNIGDEYINEDHKLGHWKDTAIRIEGQEVAALTAAFLSLFSLECKEKLSFEKYFPAQTPRFDDEGFVHFFGDGPKPMYREQVGENNYLHLIYAAKKSVLITTPYLIIDHQMASALRNAAFRGVNVTIITPHIPDKKIILNITRSNYAYLLEAGVNIYEYTPGFIHAKSVLVDDEIAFVGTINFDYRSLVHHFECGALLIGTPCLKDIKQDIEETIARSERIPPDFRLKGFARLTASILHLFSPMF